VQRTPFAQQQRAFEPGSGRGGLNGGNGTVSGAPAGGRFESGARTAQNGMRQEMPANVSPRGADNPGANGWRRFGGTGAAVSSRPEQAPSRGQGRQEGGSQAPAAGNRGGWQRFGEPGGTRQNFNAAPRQEQPNGGGFNGSRYQSPGNQQSFRVSPPVVRERQAQPQPRSYERAPGNSERYQAAPRTETPRSFGGGMPQRSTEAPRYSAPRSAPSPGYSAPRGGGGGFSAPRGGGGGFSRGNAGGGGGHSSNGGGHSGGGSRGGRR
jgi:loricrin